MKGFLREGVLLLRVGLMQECLWGESVLREVFCEMIAAGRFSAGKFAAGNFAAGCLGHRIKVEDWNCQVATPI